MLITPSRAWYVGLMNSGQAQAYCGGASGIYSFAEFLLAWDCTPVAADMVSAAGTAYASVLTADFASPPSPGWDVGNHCGAPFEPANTHGLIHFPNTLDPTWDCGSRTFPLLWGQSDCGASFAMIYHDYGSGCVQAGFAGGAWCGPSACGCFECGGPPWSVGMKVRIVTASPLCVSRRSFSVSGTTICDTSATVYSCGLVYPTGGEIILPIDPDSFVPSDHLDGVTDNNTVNFYGDVAWFGTCPDCACP